MAIRIFRSPDLRQALTHMEQDLGPEATVLYQRQLPVSRWWPFGRKEWEVVASDRSDRQVAPAPQDAGRALLEADVAELRAELASLVRSANLARMPRCGKVLVECYEHLCNRGLQPELAQSVILAAREELSSAAQGQSDAVWAAVRRQLEKGLRTRSPKLLSGTGPLVIFMLGQTGVGKTTTLAKLAARQALADGLRVAIVNMDMMRPAAQQQLELMAQPLSIAIEAAATPAAFREVLARLGDRDVVFVDTAGTSRLDTEQLDALAALVKTASRRQTFLVLNACSSLPEMSNILRGFRVAGLDGIILSKVDETDAMGAAISLAHQASTPIAYVTNGRRIPDDIVPATPELLSGSLLPDGQFAWSSQIKARPPAAPRRARTQSRSAKTPKASASASPDPIVDRVPEVPTPPEPEPALPAAAQEVAPAVPARRRKEKRTQ